MKRRNRKHVLMAFTWQRWRDRRRWVVGWFFLWTGCFTGELSAPNESRQRAFVCSVRVLYVDNVCTINTWWSSPEISAGCWASEVVRKTASQPLQLYVLRSDKLVAVCRLALMCDFYWEITASQGFSTNKSTLNNKCHIKAQIIA